MSCEIDADLLYLARQIIEHCTPAQKKSHQKTMVKWIEQAHNPPKKKGKKKDDSARPVPDDAAPPDAV